MIDQVAAAFDRQDYDAAARLLKQLLQDSPHEPWVQFYRGRLQEVQDQLDEAETTYRALLLQTANPKVAIQARQGLQRLEAVRQERRQAAIAAAAADPDQSAEGFLILEPVAGEERAAAVRSFARIMKLDPYTAQLQLPSRAWRLYRTGSMGELQVYGRELQAAGIPTFWTPLQKVQAIHVFRVHYLQTATPQATVVCQNEFDQMGSLSFDWAEVTRRVEGRLPIFEDVVDLDFKNNLKRKEQTLDYAQLCDLHLPNRNCVLRFCDLTYQFQKGVVFDATTNGKKSAVQATNRINWNNLIHFLNRQLQTVPVWSDFTTFAESALEQLDLVHSFQSHIDLFRKAETNWDPAFQLYSSLVFLNTPEPDRSE